jgi:hypothetical protein
MESICLFELSWGEKQSLTVQVAYPADVISLYQDWRRAYFGFYQSGQLRGRVGNITASVVNWRTRLTEAETRLIQAFDYWLRSAELYEIRARILSSRDQRPSSAYPIAPIQVFLTCGSIELARLPWEAWSMSQRDASQAMQILRAPLNIRDSAHRAPSQPKGDRARILAILGDDTGLDFEADRQAVQSLQSVAEIQFVGWQPDQSPTQVIQQITEAIADPLGWDILFFAGHSDETELTGGELSIAPGVDIALKDITPQLIQAKHNGLQVAIFNSCSGLSLADALIDLGFSQVAVMREPIHNKVAQEFLREFLQGLVEHLDIYESIRRAQTYLSASQAIYPSASLVPSLFCHPGAERFRIPLPSRRRFLGLLPNWIEAIALGTSLTLSLLLPVQDRLLDARLLSQAYYRSLTGQVPAQTVPPIALIQIDPQSISRRGLAPLHPINRSYLADLVNRLHQLRVPILGVDVLLDTRQPGDKALAAAVQGAVEQQTWLIFSAILDGDGELGVSPATGIASPNWMMQGYTDAHPYVVEMPSLAACEQTCPFSYMLALAHAAKQDMPNLPHPHLTRAANLRTEFLQRVSEVRSTSDRLTALKTLQLPLGLQPLVDFSMPPSHVYQQIPAWKLLDPTAAKSLRHLPNQVVLIAGSCDDRLGFSPRQSDCFPAPPATTFWTQQPQLTGGEALAYMTHHFLTQRLVVPIPDWWMVGIAALVGKGLVILGDRRNPPIRPRRQRLIRAAIASAVYGLVGLQLYISAAVLLPWLLPSAVFWAYCLSSLRRTLDD